VRLLLLLELTSVPWLLLTRPLSKLSLSEHLVLELLASLPDKLLRLLMTLLLLLGSEVLLLAATPW